MCVKYNTINTFTIILLFYSFTRCFGIDLIYTRSIQSPDVGFQKSIILVNEKFPGPTLTFKKGDYVSINVFNQLMEMETLDIHWHGIDQIDTPWNDGTAGITNCPIVYDTNFTYNFQVQEVGTFWYHSHIASRRGEGGYGFFIVEDDDSTINANNLPSYDEELHIILSDWYHQEANYIEAGLLSYGPTVAASINSPSTGFTWPGNGQAILVNGKGGNQNVYIDVVPNKIYRIRLLNAAMLAFYNFAIAGHNLTIITTGSQITNPINLTSIDISVAQRYDFLINTYNKPIESYMIQILSNWRGRDTSLAGIFNTVYLRYSQSSIISQLQPMNEAKSWDEQFYKISSKDNNENIPEPTIELYMNMSQQYTNPDTSYGIDYTGKDKNGYLRWTVNTLSNIMPSTPLLLASYYNMLDTNHYSNASLPISIDYNDVVQIIIQNRVALNGVCEQHPWHLHGYDFWVVGSGEGEYIPGVSILNKLMNPIKVDTVVNYPTSYSNSRNNPLITPNKINAHKPCGWTVIRFQAQNYGLWTFHCHIEWHLTLGMGLTFDVDTKSLWDKKGLKLPSNYGYCGFINSNTPNSRIKPASYSNNNDDDNTISFSTNIFIIIIIFTSIGSCIFVLLVPKVIQSTKAIYSSSINNTNIINTNDDLTNIYNPSHKEDETNF